MKHEILEKNVSLLALYMAVAVDIGGLIQIVPLFFQDVANTSAGGMKPYTALQLGGCDIYIREGCIGCHSQMIRPFHTETKRYGHYPVAGGSVWGHPFLRDSERTGPDLVRIGSRCSSDWHRTYLFNPRNVVPESKIPAYPWLMKSRLDDKDIEEKLEVVRTFGALYTDRGIKGTKDSLKGKTEMDTMVTYLQMLGTSIKNKR